MEMLDFCLSNNFFLFNDVWYRQDVGTAMGSCFAPSFASIMMGWWEEQVVWIDKNEELTKQFVFWTRYIDDIFMIWGGPERDLKRFLRLLEGNEVNLSFTHKSSKVEMDFLDIKIQVEEGVLRTDLHRKDTAGNSVLHAHSHHPVKLKWSIPYGELLRAKRNCDTIEGFEAEQKTMLRRFRARSYPEKVLEVAKEKVAGVNRATLLVKRPTPFITWMALFCVYRSNTSHNT